MKKLITVCILLVATMSTTIAQTSQRAKNYLTQVSNKASDYKNIAIDFTYTYQDAKGTKQQKSEGSVLLQGDLYALNFLGITKLYDGVKVYTISPEDEEVTITNYSPTSNDSVLPSQLLTFFKEGFTYQWGELKVEQGKKIQYIKLFPTNKDSNVKEILLGIDDNTKYVHKQVQYNKDGTQVSLTVNSFQTNQALSKNQFTFAQSQYPNYYINKID